MAGGVVPPLPGRMQRLPFTKAGGTDAPYSSTSGLKALERSYTVPFWPCTTMPCSSTSRLPRCLPRPMGWVALDLQSEQQCEQQHWHVKVRTCSLAGTDSLPFRFSDRLGAHPAETHRCLGWVGSRRVYESLMPACCTWDRTNAPGVFITSDEISGEAESWESSKEGPLVVTCMSLAGTGRAARRRCAQRSG